MTARILITVFLFSVARMAIGQSASNTKTFHAHEQSCHFTGTTEYEYLIQLKADSSVTFIVYSTDFRSLPDKILVKEIYKGRYSSNGNTIKATFITYNSLTKKSGDKSKLASTKQGQPNKFNQVILFNLTEQNLDPLNSYIPKMTKTSPAIYDWLGNKFDLWQSNKIVGPGSFGQDN